MPLDGVVDIITLSKNQRVLRNHNFPTRKLYSSEIYSLPFATIERTIIFVFMNNCRPLFLRELLLSVSYFIVNIIFVSASTILLSTVAYVKRTRSTPSYIATLMPYFVKLHNFKDISILPMIYVRS